MALIQRLFIFRTDVNNNRFLFTFFQLFMPLMCNENCIHFISGLNYIRFLNKLILANKKLK